MMLVDEGKVSLDDPVEKYLPEFKGQWLAVEQDKDHMLLKRPRASDHGPQHPQPYQRAAVQVGHGTTDARPAAPARRGRAAMP